MKDLYVLTREYLAKVTDSIVVRADSEADALAQASELDRPGAFLREFIKVETDSAKEVVAEKVL